MKHWTKTVLCLALALGARGVMAAQMICGETIIDDEQAVPVTEAQVLAACGAPTSKADGQWVYAQQGQFTKVLVFDAAGNLQSISDQSGGD